MAVVTDRVAMQGVICTERTATINRVWVRGVNWGESECWTINLDPTPVGREDAISVCL